jgi:hypothetical protein
MPSNCILGSIFPTFLLHRSLYLEVRDILELLIEDNDI